MGIGFDRHSRSGPAVSRPMSLRNSVSMRSHRFAEGLKFINDNPFGAAVLQSMEDWITLSIKRQPEQGPLDVVGGKLTEQGRGWAIGCRLNCTVSTRQHLSSWLSQLSAIEVEIPCRLASHGV